MRRFWVYDYETIYNLFVGCFIDFYTGERKIFIVSEFQNDFSAFYSFLEECVRSESWHFGFNNLNFDSQITQYVLKRPDLKENNGEYIAGVLYDYAQYIISKTDHNEFVDYPEWKLSIKQLDIFKINHWDNLNRMTSLKWAQFSMDWHNIEEMPLPHFKPVNKEDIPLIVDYCWNDVLSTKQLIELCLPAINLRINLQRKYNIPCINFNNGKIGSELLLKLYCQVSGRERSEVKYLRTYRSSVEVKDIIFPYIHFETPTFQALYNNFKQLVITKTKGAFNYNVKFANFELFYGLGGIHGCCESGVYFSDNEWIILDLDVGSLYPSIASVNNLYPEHLGLAFPMVYKRDIIDVRLAEKAKKNGDKAIIEGLKEGANVPYGKSLSNDSWLYDIKYGMATTINGQLSITMLIERLSMLNCFFLQANTDGITIKIKRVDVDKYYQICKEWEQLTKLNLEFATYSKMIISDVNTYIAVYEENKSPKCKGRFEWEDLQNHKPTHLHKNKSALVVSKAIYEYFVNNIDPKEYIYNNKNIYDFCLGVKMKGAWFFKEIGVKDGEYYEKKLQKIVRYFISNEGIKLIKCNPDGRIIQLESGNWKQTIFNKFEEKLWEEYDINYKYYLDLIYNEIEKIEKKSIVLPSYRKEEQLKLWD